MPPDLRGLRLLLIGNWPPPPGGVSTHMCTLREAARRAGAHVTVLDIGKGQAAQEGVFASGDARQFLARLHAMTRSHDVAHLHTSGANPKSWMLTGLVGQVARTGAARPVVTFHSGHGPKYLQSGIKRSIASLALLPYQRVICVSEDISRAIAGAGVAARRRLVAPAFGGDCGIPADLPANVAAFARRHSPLFSAMLAPGRDYGAAELFDAFARVRQHEAGAGLIVYGPGTDDSVTARLAAPVSDATMRLGAVPRAVSLAVTGASDVFVRPTLVDGDSVSVREALMLRTRVVATRVGSRPPGVVLCSPGDAADLAATIERALGEPAPQLLNARPDGVELVLSSYVELARHRLTLAA